MLEKSKMSDAEFKERFRSIEGMLSVLFLIEGDSKIWIALLISKLLCIIDLQEKKQEMLNHVIELIKEMHEHKQGSKNDKKQDKRG